MHKEQKGTAYVKPIERIRDKQESASPEDHNRFNYTLTKIQHINPTDFKPEDIRIMNETSILNKYRAQVTKLSIIMLILSLCSFIFIIIDVYLSSITTT